MNPQSPFFIWKKKNFFLENSKKNVFQIKNFFEKNKKSQKINIEF